MFGIEWLDHGGILDIIELSIGFVIGIGSRIKLLKPRDITILLQVALFGVRLMKWAAKQYHPIKKSPNMRGVDQDLTKFHEKLLKEHHLPPPEKTEKI